MEKKIYSSYDEIERDLEILNLERQIQYQKVKQGIESFKDGMTLPNLTGSALGITGQNKNFLLKTAFTFVLPHLLRVVIKLMKK